MSKAAFFSRFIALIASMTMAHTAHANGAETESNDGHHKDAMMIKDFDIGYRPDGGARVYYSYHGDALPDIYVKPEGCDEINLTKSEETWDIEPDYSPDGKSIVYSSGVGMPYLELRLMNDDGGHNREFYNGPDTEVGASWSPDGSKITFTSFDHSTMLADIYIIDSDGGGLVNLTVDMPGASTGASWSEDGKRIVFDHSDDPEGSKEIYVMAPDGSRKTRLTNSLLSKFGPIFTPDGETIVYAGVVGGYTQLFAISAQGVEESANGLMLNTSRDQHAYFPSISPDGRHLLYSAGDWTTGFSMAHLPAPHASKQ
jgi:Tol biopolymer transport system component